MAIEKLKSNYQGLKIKPGPIYKLKPIKIAMNSVRSDNKQGKNAEHMYLNS
jgi:hypothetical protein